MSSPLVVFSEDWGAHPSSTQHLILRMLEDRSVIWVNSIGMRPPRANAADVRRVAMKLSAMAGKPKKRSPRP